jgi:hypothetical protein
MAEKAESAFLLRYSPCEFRYEEIDTALLRGRLSIPTATAQAEAVIQSTGFPTECGFRISALTLRR